MPRRPIDPDNPDKLQYYVPVLFNRRDMDVIERVSSAYGISLAAAVRLMVGHGATRYDPYATED